MELAFPSAGLQLPSRQCRDDLHHLGRSKLRRVSHGIFRADYSCASQETSVKHSSGAGASCCGLCFPKHASARLFPHRESGSWDPRFPVLACPPRRRLLCSNGCVGAVGGSADDDGLVGPVDAEKLQGWERKVEKVGEVLSNAFPLWIALAGILALAWPNSTSWINAGIQVMALSVAMLGMGMTLTLQDFQGAFAMPKELFVGVLLQYSVMPSAGYAVSRLLQLPSHYAAGLILVSCCPGGTASNIVTYLARGNVALSVLMTVASTFLAVVMTPVLTAKLVGQYVSVDGFALFASTVQVVLLPVVMGAILNYFFKRLVKIISLVAPTIAVFMVSILVAGAVGHNSAAILASGGQVVLAVLALHIMGFAWGYILSRLLGIEKSSSRTISIEVGMQNSVLGVVLATQHFSNPLTTVPCAVSSICHSLIGSALAGFWRLSIPKVNTIEDRMKAEMS